MLPIVQVTNLARTLREISKAGYWIYGMDGDAKGLIYNCDLTGQVALVAGSEGRGVSPAVKKACDGLLRIPMRGQIGSYNVSVATGMALGEVLRQQESAGS